MALQRILGVISQFMNIFVLLVYGSIAKLLEALNLIMQPMLKITRTSAVPANAAKGNRSELKRSESSSKLVIPGRSFANIHNRLYLALYEAKQAEIMAQHELKQNFLVVPLASVKACEVKGAKEDSESFNPSSLIEIFKFDEMACTLERKNPTIKLVFCTGAGQPSQVRVAFLVGCHMIMSHGVDSEETHLAFKNFHGLFQRFSPADGGGVTVESCWHALYRAKSLNWIDFRKVSPQSPHVLTTSVLVTLRIPSLITEWRCWLPLRSVYERYAHESDRYTRSAPQNRRVRLSVIGAEAAFSAPRNRRGSGAPFGAAHVTGHVCV
jgi:hypothetical protein